MACFLIPAGEAVVTTIAAAIVKSKEKKTDRSDISFENTDIERKIPVSDAVISTKIPLSRKLSWLNIMLWGGAVLLLFEHIWHGEVVPWFPFLTAASSPESAADMFHEMFTAGIAMAAIVTVVWLIIVGVVSLIEKKSSKALSEQK